MVRVLTSRSPIVVSKADEALIRLVRKLAESVDGDVDKGVATLAASLIVEKGLKDPRLLRIVFYYLYGGKGVKLTKEDRMVLEKLRTAVKEALEKYRRSQVIEVILDTQTFAVQKVQSYGGEKEEGEEEDPVMMFLLFTEYMAGA